MKGEIRIQTQLSGGMPSLAEKSSLIPFTKMLSSDYCMSSIVLSVSPVLIHSIFPMALS